MNSLRHIQQMQLKLFMSASVNETCALDLMSIVYALSATDARTVLGIIELLINEAETLRTTARALTSHDAIAQ